MPAKKITAQLRRHSYGHDRKDNRRGPAEDGKVCIQCDLYKPLSDFYKAKIGGYYQPRCKTCAKANAAARKKENQRKLDPITGMMVRGTDKLGMREYGKVKRGIENGHTIVPAAEKADIPVETAISYFAPRGFDIAEKEGHRPPIARDNQTPGAVRAIALDELLARGPRYSMGGEAAFWETGRNWSMQDRQNLSVLCSGAADVNRAAAILGRSPSSIAWTARDMGLVMASDWSALIRPKKLYKPKPKRLQLSYPYLIKARPSDTDLLRVNDLVPRAFPEAMRADICQSVMLALYEGEVTLAEIEANRDRLSWFVRKWRREQAPHQEISLEIGDDDDRAYYEIGADPHGRNEARLMRDGYLDHYEATQIDDVYDHEVSTTAYMLAGDGLLTKHVRQSLDAGDLFVRDFVRPDIRAWEHIHFSKHARDRLSERFGVTIDQRKAIAILEYCRGREPERGDAYGEMHILPQGIPVIYRRQDHAILSTLPSIAATGERLAIA